MPPSRAVIYPIAIAGPKSVAADAAALAAREETFWQLVRRVLRQVDDGYTTEATAVNAVREAAETYKVAFPDDAERFAREEGVQTCRKSQELRSLWHIPLPQISAQGSVSTMASTTNDGGEMTAVSAPTDKAIVTSSGTKTFHLPTEQTRDIPSRRPREIFDFMALTGELRNAIYQAVIDTMATTPDNPIALIPETNCIRSGYWSDDEDLDRIPMEELVEIGRISKLRMNLATCRLGEVSRQIRSEFVPMLLGSLHFRICACLWGDPGSQSIIQAPVHQLSSMIHHLDYYTHFLPPQKPSLRELSDLLDALLSIRFNGELKIVSFYDETSLVLDCFDTFCASVREGESRTRAYKKAFKVVLRRHELFGGLSIPLGHCEQTLAFRFDCNEFLDEYVQTQTIGPASSHRRSASSPL
ncbi:hypothetical protein BFW01_g2928 [Lasiodiplodia theobromae]|nr:hypothetical protein BFW01_g2928 [Lasiodiplodia theobromae]